MADCEVLEKDCSHFIPGLFGSLISTVIIALSLFVFEWRMALWVIPVSAAIVVGSYRVQDRVQAKTMAAKMACADGIQEYIETLRDLKASNAEQRYLSGLSDKIRAVEKQSIARTFLKDAPIILLDEATASLDVENETAIQEALSRLIKHKTVLIIAHRMRTVAGADKIVVLSDGVVAEQGAPDALYARNGQYTHMVDLQSASQNWTI